MKTYAKKDIKIGWEPEKCTHSVKCALGLSKVFKPKEKSWIQPENGSKQEIINQVGKCLSGALTIQY
ncbi:MAG: (4Fe-4S)-binding protein [Polaribacter sp.]|uniref:(4Fe-4S)-binding protein n=1 Tax=Polaribacter sp. TaxID=1920175 RepID=UPI002F35185B